LVSLLTENVEALVTQWCYLGIFAAMVLENVIPPIPSEVIMPLAASACVGQWES
jgi:membrane protein DedA with SNARE-associated domain